MPKAILITSDSLDDSLVIVKVICSECSPYGAEDEEVDFVESEVQAAIAKGFIKASKAKVKPAIQDDQV